MENKELKITFQQLLSIESPDSKVIKSGKILFCKLMTMDVDLPKLLTSGRDKMLAYVNNWRNKWDKAINMMKDNPKVEYIMFFIQDNETRESRFALTVKVKGVISHSKIKDADKNRTYFDFELVDDFLNLEGRAVINWVGQAPMQYWYNNGDPTRGINPKQLVKIDELPCQTSFITYEEVVLNFLDLQYIFKTEDKDWKEKLQAVNCVYAIVEKETGNTYIGVTYNNDGIWGRWKDYAETGHGGDVELKKYIKKIEDAHRFQWTILETLPKGVSNVTAIARENLYKEKLCSRAMLNKN
ncbi:MAG: GIY-YIG nuclease family protein [Bacteroidales bacterium]|nr:GIY-YIG nuclease family protein [Bacteroidales bacterium]